MQTKKRAKPVKFGKKDEPASPKKDEALLKKIEEEAEDIKKRVKELEDDPVVVAPDALDAGDEEDSSEKAEIKKPHGVEAHFSSVQTLDIKESPEVETEDTIEEEVGEEKTDTEDVEVREATNDTQVEEDESLAEDAVSSEGVDGSVNDNEQPEQKDEEYFNTPPDESDSKKGMFSYFAKVVVITFLVGIAFIGGIYYAVTNKDRIDLFPSKESEITEAAAEATPTEKPVDLTKYTIEVLNGSGTSGVAAKVKTTLEAEGFKVGSIGNAGTSDYTETEIAAGSSVEKEYIEKLKEVLGKTYKVSDDVTSLTVESDVTVTMGSDQAE